VEPRRTARCGAEECRRATREGGRGACEARLRERGADAGAALAAAQEQGARWALAAATNALRAGYEAAERANGCGDPSYYAGVEDAALSALEQVDALDAAEVCRQARGGDDA